MLKTKTIPAYRVCPKCGGAMHCEGTHDGFRYYYCRDPVCDGKRSVPIRGKVEIVQENVSESEE